MAVSQRRRIRSQARQSLLANRTKTKCIMREALEEHADELMAEFKDVVADWSPDNQPEFVKEVRVSEREIRVVVRPRARRKASTIFGYTDKGTKPHVIKPKRRRPKANIKPSLAFQVDYSPRTLPIARAHVGTGRKSGAWTFPQIVHHPGTKARLFSETIQRDTYPRYRRTIENAFQRMAREANRK